ncbi:tail tape measure protein [Sphingobium sufflavum]|uniref:tail tape measure protein n=1 Tax=Sphingobium sufflavum TaxID=1129547 RepID=UPI001F28D3BA|nr:tail tape measure protein [Sphingobium sufflavum]MCE7798645.1 tail tape measure protein [Sphingobium sufflavum]
MTDEIETLTVGVRAEVSGFARDVDAMRGSLEGPLVAGADKAGRMIEQSLLRAVRTGKTGFDDLRRIVLNVMAEIAASAVKAGLASIGVGVKTGGSSGGSGDGGTVGGNGGLLALGANLLGSVLGLPGRATGGPVSPGRAFLVGERGPEVFVPTSSGSVAPMVGGGGRDVRIAIHVNAPQGENSRLLGRSARQVARAVRSALAE